MQLAGLLPGMHPRQRAAVGVRPLQRASTGAMPSRAMGAGPTPAQPVEAVACDSSLGRRGTGLQGCGYVVCTQQNCEARTALSLGGPAPALPGLGVEEDCA